MVIVEKYVMLSLLSTRRLAQQTEQTFLLNLSLKSRDLWERIRVNYSVTSRTFQTAPRRMKPPKRNLSRTSSISVFFLFCVFKGLSLSFKLESLLKEFLREKGR